MSNEAPPRPQDRRRIADVFLHERMHRKSMWLQREVAASQKFFVDVATTKLLIQYAEPPADQDLTATAARLAKTRWPFRTCWLEVETLMDGGVSAEAYMVRCDETLQTGTIMHFADFGLIFPLWTCFDLRTPQAWLWPGRQLGLRATGATDFVPATSDQRAAWHELMGHWSKVLCGFLEVMNQHKTIIEREDFGEYNKRRHRLGRPRRQEYHLVRIVTEGECVVYTGAREGASTPKGEHTVRGHPRVLSSGRVSWVKPHRRGHGPVKAPRAGYELVPPSFIAET